MPLSIDQLRAQIIEAEPALKRLDVEIESIEFDPLIPESVDEARKAVSRVIGAILAGFAGNPILGRLPEELECQYQEMIDEQVKAARSVSS